MIHSQDIKKSRLYSVLVLERFFAHGVRHRIKNIIGVIIFLFVIVVVATLLLKLFNFLPGSLADFVAILSPKITGIILILLAIWYTVFLLEGFFRSKYFKEQEISKKEIHVISDENLLSLEVARILYIAKDEDITKAFFKSSTGKRILVRLGIGRDDSEYFLNARKEGEFYGIDIPLTDHDKLFTLVELCGIMLTADNELREFFFARGIKEQEFVGAAEWVVQENEDKKSRERWWSQENLERIGGLGKDWSYGGAYQLRKYATELLGSRFPALHSQNKAQHKEELQQIEVILSKKSEANVMIVGDPGVGKIDLLRTLAGEIKNKNTTALLEEKKIMVLDGNYLISSSGEKATFELMVMNLFADAIKSGNIILVIPDFSSFMLSAKMLGSDIVSIIDPYLSSADIQIIATSDMESFHQLIEQDAGIMQRFEKVTLEEPDNTSVIRILERIAESSEKEGKIFVTYQAILEIAESANRYITTGVMPNKAIDLLAELMPIAMQEKRFFIVREDVLNLIRAKTHIPVGKVGNKERDTLTHLEDVLHARVVGQDKAVEVVANAMRRARAGVRNLNKPIGSYLFLGPTGVGKTETAKALAEAFFEDENKMSRIDMSEYQTDDALARLIGSFETGNVGTLATLLREKPYGVVLLDEFEKTNPSVHDLFLQILDEGFFSDMRGKKINARNSIFIATSNAGSDMIWEAIKEGKTGESIKGALVEDLINEGTFRPEFLNRFDAVVVFHPLENTHLSKIAELMLKKLQKRLHDRNIDLVINNALLEYVSEEGYNKAFGARPMNRFIQEKVEQRIADKIISGELPDGSKIEFSREELV